MSVAGLKILVAVVMVVALVTKIQEMTNSCERIAWEMLFFFWVRWNYVWQ